MKLRIRAGGLIVKDNSILLVKHKHRGSGKLWWTPPGGGYESFDDSVIACVRRECKEEAGLNVDVGPLIYLREFTQKRRRIRHLELFFLITNWGGTPNLEHLPDEDRHHVLDVAWMTPEHMSTQVVLPAELKKNLWLDLKKQGLPTIYLGALSCAFEKKRQ
jgi:8-oxo-dGTP diphosphatase